MEIKVGSSDIRDIQIGSTAINTVWVGATKVWQRMALVVTGSGYAYAEGSTATAFRNIAVDPAPTGTVAWSHVVTAGPTNGGVLSFQTIGDTYQISLSNSSGFDSSTATVAVTAVADGNTASTTTNLTAVRDTP